MMGLLCYAYSLCGISACVHFSMCLVLLSAVVALQSLLCWSWMWIGRCLH